MEEQKYELLENHDYSLDHEAEDSLGGVKGTYFSPTNSDKLRRRKQWRTILHVVIGLVFAAVFYLLGLYTPAMGSDPYLSKPFGSGHCGNSSEEAINNGCVIDFIPGGWVHPDCYDEELERDFLEYAGRHWYTDPEGKQELSEDFMRQTGGPNPVYVSMKYHDAHCAYTWKKLHRAILRGKPIDSQIGEYPHTKHCSKALSIARDAEKFPWKAPARFFTIFTSCELPQKCK